MYFFRSPVFDRSSDSLRFHIPPSVTKNAAKVCAVAVDGRCHGYSIITYSSLPSCIGIQPKVTWKRYSSLKMSGDTHKIPPTNE